MRYKNKMMTAEDAELAKYLAAVRVLFDQRKPQPGVEEDKKTTEEHEANKAR